MCLNGVAIAQSDKGCPKQQIIMANGPNGQLVACSNIEALAPDLAKGLQTMNGLAKQNAAMQRDLRILTLTINKIAGLVQNKDDVLATSLAKFLEAAGRHDASRAGKDISALNQKLEEIQKSLDEQTRNPATGGRTKDALGGVLGDDLARLDFANVAKGLSKTDFDNGMFMLDMGQPCAASAYFKRARQSDPENAEAQFQYALLASKYKSTCTAIEFSADDVNDALQKYLVLDPNGSHAAQAKEILGGKPPAPPGPDLSSAMAQMMGGGTNMRGTRAVAWAMNPLTTEGNVKLQACTSMMQLWNTRRKMAPPQERGKMDEAKAAEYQSDLMNGLIDIRQRMLSESAPGGKAKDQIDYSHVKDLRDLAIVCSDFTRIVKDFRAAKLSGK